MIHKTLKAIWDFQSFIEFYFFLSPEDHSQSCSTLLDNFVQSQTSGTWTKSDNLRETV